MEPQLSANPQHTTAAPNQGPTERRLQTPTPIVENIGVNTSMPQYPVVPA